MTSQPHWFIVGAGAIGLLWADQLNALGQRVTLLIKANNPPGSAQKQEFKITDLNHQTQPLTVTIATMPASDEPQEDSPAVMDYLLVATKAYDVVAAIKQLKHRIGPTTVVVLCHNGMGTIEPVQQLLGHQQPLLFVSTTHGAFKPDPYHVVHTGSGTTNMGWICPPPALSSPHQTAITTTLNQILAPVSWPADIHQALWLKLAINCVINPLTAIHQCKNGDLCKPQFNIPIDQLVKEIHQVLSANQQTISLATIQSRCYQVIRDTADNYSSMNRDLHAKRKTEIDYITGYLLDQGRQHNLKLPANQVLYERIKILAAQG